MADIKIEKAQECDWPYIKEKLKKYVLDGTDAQWHQFFVAKFDGKTVGFARIIERGNAIEIASVGVDYYQRKKGVGKNLLKFLIEKAKELYPNKPIFGVTHRPGFLAPFGFKEVEDAPEVFKHKKSHGCVLHHSKIKIMRLMD
ncbi:MAG: GNAT family N-acetyltransferase [Candidatus Orphnella occulta]|nr:GNAT family N-acetyltransferase [Candidatus Orphnella occulta]